MGLLDLIFVCLTSYQFWILLCVTYFLKRYLSWRGYNLPPRPQSLPIIGNVHKIFFNNSILYKWCAEVAKDAGPVIRISFGPFDAVVLNDLDPIQEAMVDRGIEMGGRIKMILLEVLSDNYSNIVGVDADHPTFVVRRKLLATALRNFSVGRAYEQRVAESLSKLIEHLDVFADKDEAFDPRDYCKLVTYNVITNVLFQKGFAFDDEDFVTITNMFQEASEGFDSPVTISDYVPFVRSLPFDLFDVKPVRRLRNSIMKMIERETELAKIRGEETGVVGDLAYYVLKTRKEGAKERFTDVTDTQILHILSDVFVAGSDTTQSSLRWLLVCLASYQDVQSKVYNEIAAVVPDNDHDVLVSAIDCKSRMPYSEAVLLESTRFATVVPMGVPHKALCDTKVHGYDIPKGMLVLVNQYAVNHDEKNFPKPEEFIPERFLDEEGKVGPRPKGYLPFGLGRRSCPGETTARTTLWMLYVSLVKRYRILPPEGEILKPEHNADFNKNPFDGTPRPFKIRLARR